MSCRRPWPKWYLCRMGRVWRTGSAERPLKAQRLVLLRAALPCHSRRMWYGLYTEEKGPIVFRLSLIHIFGAKGTAVAPTELAVNVSATLLLAAGHAIGQVQEPVEQAIETYLRSVRQRCV